MLIFSDLPEILIEKADLIRKIVICKLFFKQKCHKLTHKINTQIKIGILVYIN